MKESHGYCEMGEWEFLSLISAWPESFGTASVLLTFGIRQKYWIPLFWRSAPGVHTPTIFSDTLSLLVQKKVRINDSQRKISVPKTVEFIKFNHSMVYHSNKNEKL